MKVYTQLSLEEREIIFTMSRNGAFSRAIGTKINRHYSTVSRELKRNKDLSLGYIPDRAHNTSKKRKYKLIPKIDRQPDLKEVIIEKLNKKWSPDAISGRMKLEGAFVSTETIYQFTYSDEGQELRLPLLLATHRKKRNKRHSRKARIKVIPERVSIHERPEIINNRTEEGHFECDLTFFKGNQSRNIMVAVERKSRYAFFIKNDSKNANHVGKNLFNRLASIPDQIRKSITFDNGSEFTRHRLVRDHLNMNTYFCYPRSPWQKALVEKINAMLHRFLPKNDSIFFLTESRLMEIQNQFNSIPRKILGYRTSAEVFNEFLGRVALHP